MRWWILSLIGVWSGGTAASAEPSRPNVGAHYVGTASCSAYGCHGNHSDSSGPTWKSSFTLWARHDPHAGAYRTLFSNRSAQMVQRLIAAHSQLAPAFEDSPDEVFTQQYHRVLQARCVGCHATPSAASVSGRGAEASWSGSLPGVSCESCHGAAGSWLHEHTTTRWRNVSADRKQALHFVPTESLAARATVCMPCHVGPRTNGSSAPFDVHHELIAAGHPRLQFEFSAYLQNLPPHWDAAADRARHPTPHWQFDAWRIGQREMAIQLATQLTLRLQPDGDAPNSGSTWPELSNFDCYACHHRLSLDRLPGDRLSGAKRPGITAGLPPPADWPMDHERILAASSSDQGSASRQGPQADSAFVWTFLTDPTGEGSRSQLRELQQRWIGERTEASPQRLSWEQRGAIVQRLLERVQTEAVQWDDVVQFQLALAAILADGHSKAPLQPARDASESLLQYLNRQFGTETPTIYDSPTKFDRTSPELQARLAAIAATIPLFQQMPLDEEAKSP